MTAHDELDHSIREVGTTCLRLRGDLIFTPQGSVGSSSFLIEDQISSRFFRLGHVEYLFVSMLDGSTSIQEALRRLSNIEPHHRLSQADAAGICRWLVDMDLAQTNESASGSRLATRAQSAGMRQALLRWNPLIFRLPLFRPDRLLDYAAHGFGWLFSPWALVVWFGLVANALYQVCSDWNRFVVSSRGVFSPENWIWIAACWVFLKVLHEAAHGIVCRRYGGSVREAGVLFLLCAPLAYVDVTSSWRFRSRYQRIHVAAAGMYMEFLVAALAAAVWSATDSGWLNSLCFNAIVMAGVSSFVFNANPLMRFDGYYILSDALDIPNLYANGQQFVRYFARKYFFGVTTSLPDWSLGKGSFIRLYGVASWLWRIVVCVSLTIAAVTLFHGAGIVLACVAVVLWIGKPALQFLRYFLSGTPGEQPRRVQFVLTAVVPTLIVIAICLFVPWPGARQAPGVVEYGPHTLVRAKCAGFVRRICVQDGQLVRKGQVLVRLENRELSRDLADLKLQIQQSDIRGRQLEQKGEFAAQQAEAKQRESLRSHLAEAQFQVNQLTVRASRDGHVVCRDLQSLLGTYVDQGDEIVMVGNESEKTLRVSVSQDDLDAFTQLKGQPVRIDIPYRAMWTSHLEQIDPRATVEPSHPALTAINGGYLPVRQVTDPQQQNKEQEYELLAARFTGLIPLPPQMSRQLLAGQTATVSYRPCNVSIGQHLYHCCSNWIRHRLEASQD